MCRLAESRAAEKRGFALRREIAGGTLGEGEGTRRERHHEEINSTLHLSGRFKMADERHVSLRCSYGVEDIVGFPSELSLIVASGYTKS